MGEVINLSDVSTESFNESKKSIQALSKMIAKISSGLHPSNKNYEEHSLKISPRGLRSSPIPVYENDTVKFVELTIDLVDNVIIISSAEYYREINLSNRSLKSILIEFQSTCKKLSLPIDNKINLDQSTSEYIISKMDSRIILLVLTSVYSKFLEFKSPILKEMSNINFWPHHFDIAMLLFSPV